MKIRKQIPLPPDPGRLTFFIDPSNVGQQKDPASNTISTGGLSGAPITLEETTAPTADDDGVWVYSKDVSGISELFVMDGDGNEIQITSNGAVLPASSGGGGQFWATDIQRASFDAGGSPVSAPFTVDTGIILAPTPSQASLYHFRCITAQTTVSAVASTYFGGWIAFTDDAGTPDTRVNEARMFQIPSYTTWFITEDTTPLLVGYGCSVLATGELRLHFNAPSGDNWLAGSIAVTSFPLTVDLVPGGG